MKQQFRGKWTETGRGKFRTWSLEHPDKPDIVFARVFPPAKNGPYVAYIVNMLASAKPADELYSNTRETLKEAQDAVVAELRRRHGLLSALFP